MPARIDRFLGESRAARARSASTEGAASSDNVISLALGSVIQRGIRRSSPSGPRTVSGRSAREPPRTTTSSLPASGWNG